MKKFSRLCLIVFILLEPWLVSLVHCEILTARYADESMYAACDEHGMVDAQSIKVLDYRRYSYCKIYVRAEDSGHIFILTYNFDGEASGWEAALWDAVWSASGSADGFVWPYIR